MKTKSRPPNIEELSEWAKKGWHGKTRRALLSLNLARLKREDRAAVADLARRVNMPSLMIRVLRPVVKAESPVTPAPTVRERALYATALSRLGVFNEAQEELDALRKTDDADVILFRAYNQMFQWNSAGAVPLLRAYVARRDITPYARLVGMVNLASSLSGKGSLAECEKVLAELFSKLPPESALLYGNAIEIAAQVAVKQGDFERAREWIAKGEMKLAGGESRYEMFIKKWRVVLNLMESPGDAAALSKYLNVKNEAAKAGNWEVARDLDFLQAQATRDDRLFLKVYFGSPYPEFRKRIAAIYSPQFQIPPSFRHTLGEREGGEPSRCFSFLTGGEVSGGLTLSDQPLLLRLFQILSSDFYRPLDLGTVVSQLYPDEFFNPQSSPLKITQVLKRLRDWFQENQVPLAVVVKGGKLRLTALAPYGIEVPARMAKPPDRERQWLEKLREAMADRPFTTEQAAELLGVSRPAVLKFLAWAKAGHGLKQTAAGRSARYRFRR